MKYTFAEKKMDSSEDLRAYATRKIGKLDKLFRDEGELVALTANDMYASVDSGVAAIERQIRKNKTKLAKRIREGALEKYAEEAAYIAPVEEEDEPDEFNIVRSKQFSIKPMSAQEAILQMNMLGHDFFVFRKDDADGPIAVVYRRKSADYGLIVDDGE